MNHTLTNAQLFSIAKLPHCLMITNHGMHQWDVIPGLPDTGGQNVYVNQFSQALADTGYRVTIVNRGGYPHPVTGQMRSGVHYLDDRQRILYLEDGTKRFIRKEDMAAQIPALVKNLQEQLIFLDEPVDLIISHYWDGGMLAEGFIKASSSMISHIWIPHSLAAIKRRNMPPESWPDLRLDERQAYEQTLVNLANQIGTTSPLISRSLCDDYGFRSIPMDMPPCINTKRFYPFTVLEDDPIWSFLAKHSVLTVEKIRAARIISEISRTDQTKRKDILLKAFAQIHQKFQDTLLLITISGDDPVSENLLDLIKSLHLQEAVIILGNVSQMLPTIYNLSTVYCTPSVMEGFGMSAQEAAACACPVIASDLVPFVYHYLLGSSPSGISEYGLLVGKGGIVFPADDIPALYRALEIILEDPEGARKMGAQALSMTIPQFTWQKRVMEFLKQIPESINGTGREACN